MSQINTYPAMNAKVVEFLRISDQGIDLYAAQLIEELQAKVEEMQKTLEFYGNKNNWELPSFGRGHSPVIADRGESARQALKEGEK